MFKQKSLFTSAVHGQGPSHYLAHFVTNVQTLFQYDVTYLGPSKCCKQLNFNNTQNNNTKLLQVRPVQNIINFMHSSDRIQ